MENPGWVQLTALVEQIGFRGLLLNQGQCAALPLPLQRPISAPQNSVGRAGFAFAVGRFVNKGTTVNPSLTHPPNQEAVREAWKQRAGR